MLKVFNVKKGDTFSFTITFKNLQVDLTTARFGVKKDYEDTTFIIDKSLGHGIEKVSTGKYRVDFSASESANLDPDQYVFDFRFTISSIVGTPLSGYLIIEESVFNG